MSGATPGTVGSVVSLWRYPVKSLMGEELNASEVTERGLLGDRAHALIDATTGKVASAKNPRKWARLFDCRAGYLEPPRTSHKLPGVRVTLPDGAVVSSDHTNFDQIVSLALGRDLTFATSAPEKPSLEEYWPDIDGLAHRETITDEAMPAGVFFDYATIHLLTTATLDCLRELYPQGRWEVRRFRPNIVVDAGGAKDFIENSWVGRTVAVGDQVRLKINIPCPRCVMTTLPQGDLPNDPGILRTAAQHTPRFKTDGQTLVALVGVYASVERGGTIHRGDPVRVE